LDEIRRVLEGFCHALASMIAGVESDMALHADSGLATRISAALRPLRVPAVRPDFGAFAEVCIDGDLFTADSIVRAKVEFDDESSIETATGSRVRLPRRRVALTLLLTVEPCRVVECVVTTAARSVSDC